MCEQAVAEGVGSWTDEQLIGECLRNEQAAWGELIRRYEGMVRAIAAKRGLHGQDAFDLNQLVWTQVYLKLVTVRKARSVRSWLSTLTKNACYHFQLKRQRIRHRETDRFDIVDLENRNAVAPYDPLGQEAQQRLLAAVAELKPRCQTLIRMLFFMQPKPSYREIATEIGVAEASVSALRDRCLRELFRRLEDEMVA